MSRKIARQSEVTPLNTIDEYLWNQRLGITQMPPVSPMQGQAPTSSLPPQPSQASTIDYDASNAPSDMFGSGVNSEGQSIAPTKVPMAVPKSAPAVSKAAAVSTLYGDVEPTPTTGESSDNGSQSGRNNSPNSLPNGPDSAPASNAVEDSAGGAGLASDLGEAASLAAFASKHWIGSVLDPKEAATDIPLSCPGCGEKTSRFWVNGTCKTCGYDNKKETSKEEPSYQLASKSNSKEASMDWNDRYAGNEPHRTPWPANNRSDIVEHIIKEHEPIIRYLMGDDQSRNQVINNLRDTTSVPSQYGTAWEHFDQLHYFHHMRPGVMMSQPADHEHGNDGLDGRQASKDKKDHYKYIRHNSKTGKWEIWQKSTGKTLSTHDSKEKAEAAFRAMEMSMHGG